jgi:hypothetical protein
LENLPILDNYQDERTLVQTFLLILLVDLIVKNEATKQQQRNETKTTIPGKKKSYYIPYFIYCNNETGNQNNKSAGIPLECQQCNGCTKGTTRTRNQKQEVEQVKEYPKSQNGSGFQV